MTQEIEQLTDDEKELLNMPVAQLKLLGRYHSAWEAVNKKFTINRKENEAHNESAK